MRALVALGLVAGCAGVASSEPRTDEAPLVIELFTSQGCSSCPPADQLLSKLAHAGQLDGRVLAPLSFHVDYWNDLGWADPYSSPAWTERQQQYARSLGDRGVYTPELVVAGGVGMVGSERDRVTAAIAAAPKPREITAAATWTPTAVTITAAAPDDADVWVAIWEESTSTRVTRGENSGETLVSDRVVRTLQRVAIAGHPGTLHVPLPSGWIAGGAVAFAQRPDHRIVGARLLPR